jgi:hypothetical protein
MPDRWPQNSYRPGLAGGELEAGARARRRPGEVMVVLEALHDDSLRRILRMAL